MPQGRLKFWLLFVRISLMGLWAMGSMFVFARTASALQDARKTTPGDSGTVVCGPIASDTHWQAAGNPYQVTCNAEVAQGVVLTVDPSVIVQFTTGTQLTINGSLQAVGTVSQPITFTSANASPAPGDWMRLWLAADHGASTLEHVVVEYAGGAGDAAVVLDAGSLTLRDSTLRLSISDGLWARIMPTLLNNTFADNGGRAVRLLLDDGLGAAGQIAGNQGSGNGLNGIYMQGTVDGDLSLGSNPNLPYYVSDAVLTVSPGQKLTLDAGVIIKMANSMLNVEGSLKTLGMAGSEVVFTSLQDDTWGGDTNGDGGASLAAPGDWWRIFLSSGAQADLAYTVIRYAGRDGIDAVYAEEATLTAQNCTFQNNLGHGLVIQDAMPTLLNNLFDNNGGKAISVALENGMDQPGQIGGNQGTGNGNNGIFIRGNVDQDLTLDTNPGLPYVVVDGQLRVVGGSVLTLPAGVVVKLHNGLISVQGALTAQGTAQDKVVFTSFQDDTSGGDTNGDGGASAPARGDWWRIYVHDGGSAYLGHTTVRYAGQSTTNAVDVENSTLTVLDAKVQYSNNAGIGVQDAVFTVSNSYIGDNDGNGVQVYVSDPGLQPTISDNTLANNGGYALSIRSEPSTAIGLFIENNTGTGNGTNGILLDVVLDTTTLKNNVGLPYVIQSLDTKADATVTVGAGTVFKADRLLTGSGGKLISHGQLHVEGQEGSQVVFTSLRDDTYGGDTNGDGNATQPAPGDWRGMTLFASVQPQTEFRVYLPLVSRGTSGGSLAAANQELASKSAEQRTALAPTEWEMSLDHALIRYGGYDQANLEVFGGSVRLTNSIVEYSANKGIYVEDASPQIYNSTISNNAETGLRMYGKTVSVAPVLVDNILSNNGTYAAYLIFNGGCHSDTEMHGNTGAGNGKVNGIYMEGYVDTPLGCRWQPNPQLPYVLWTITVSETGRLTIDPGVQVKFVDPDLNRGTGTLIVSGMVEALGTANEPVYFTSFWDDAVGGDTDGDGGLAGPLRGDWIGLVARQGSSLTLEHIILRYGGSMMGANLSVTGGSVQMSNSNVAFGADEGLSLLCDGTAQMSSISSTDFVGNAGYAVALRSEAPALARFAFAANQASGNGVNGVLLDASLDNLTFQANPTLPYVIQTVTVPPGRTVTAEAGVVFKGDQGFSGGGSLFAVNGVFRAEGLAGNPVYFTSLHDDGVGGDTLGDGAQQPGPGSWLGLNVGAGGQAELNHSIVRYAGSDDSALFNDGGQLVIADSAIVYNQGTAISNQGAGTLTVTHSAVSYNTGAGVSNSASGVASVNYCNVMGNGGYGVRSSAPYGSYMPAEYNYWGSATGPSWDQNYCENPPSGTGDLITCHNVDYMPFATTPYP